MKDDSQIIIYKTRDGKTKLQVKFEGETVWLSQAQVTELFETTKQNISLHIRNIFEERELSRSSVVKEYLTTTLDGKRLKKYVKSRSEKQNID